MYTHRLDLVKKVTTIIIANNNKLLLVTKSLSVAVQRGIAISLMGLL